MPSGTARMLSRLPHRGESAEQQAEGQGEVLGEGVTVGHPAAGEPSMTPPRGSRFSTRHSTNCRFRPVRPYTDPQKLQ